MGDQVKHTVGVAALVVVPRDELDEVIGEGNTGLGVEDGRAGIRDKVGGDHSVFGVAQDASELAVGGGLDGVGDLRVLGALLKGDGEVNHGHVGGGNAEGHASELAVQGGDDLADGLGGAGGRGDDVDANSATAAAPVLEGGAVDSGLGGSGGVYGGHETLLDTEVVIDDLGEGCQAVGGARGVGHDLDVFGVALVVHAHHEHGGVVGRGSREDDLLGTTDEVLGGAFLLEEFASGLNDVISAGGTPLNLGGVKLVGDGDGLAINVQLAVLDDDGAGVLAVH